MRFHSMMDLDREPELELRLLGMTNGLMLMWKKRGDVMEWILSETLVHESKPPVPPPVVLQPNCQPLPVKPNRLDPLLHPNLRRQPWMSTTTMNRRNPSTNCNPNSVNRFRRPILARKS